LRKQNSKEMNEKMKITVFGASGKTGLEVVKKALSQGFWVSAYVRRENALALQDPNLDIIVGNLDEKEKISELIKGSEACISTLGGSSLKKPAPEVRNGIALILDIMKEQKVARFIYLSSLGAGESRYYMGRIARFLVADLFLKVPIADHNINEDQIKNSDLDWTILRPGGLSNEAEGGEIKSGSSKIIFKGNPKISRANVAAFIIDELKESRYSKQAVWLYE
jgi:putative NADH-flavin reductase